MANWWPSLSSVGLQNFRKKSNNLTITSIWFDRSWWYLIRRYDIICRLRHSMFLAHLLQGTRVGYCNQKSSVVVRLSSSVDGSVFVGSFLNRISQNYQIWYEHVCPWGPLACQKFGLSNPRWPTGGHFECQNHAFWLQYREVFLSIWSWYFACRCSTMVPKKNYEGAMSSDSNWPICGHLCCHADQQNAPESTFLAILPKLYVVVI